jgi:hypothetical protein
MKGVHYRSFKCHLNPPEACGVGSQRSQNTRKIRPHKNLTVCSHRPIVITPLLHIAA